MRRKKIIPGKATSAPANMEPSRSIDQTAIHDLEVAISEAQKTIKLQDGALLEAQGVLEQLKNDTQTPGHKNGSITARAAFQIQQLNNNLKVAEPSASPANTVKIKSDPVLSRSHRERQPTRVADTDPIKNTTIPTRDLMRLYVLTFIDAINNDKAMTRDAKKDANLVESLQKAINIVGRDRGALDEMLEKLKSALGNSSADKNCSSQYKNFKKSVLRNCLSSYEQGISGAQVSDADALEKAQASINKVTYALDKSQSIKRNMSKEQFNCVIHVMRGCWSEHDIDDKLFLISRMFPKITKEIGDVVRNNLELYRVESVNDLRVLNEEVYALQRGASSPTLFKSTPPPVPPRKTQSDKTSSLSYTDKSKPYTGRPVPPPPASSPRAKESSPPKVDRSIPLPKRK